MIPSEISWNNVWSETEKPQGYGYLQSRNSRALDKLGHYISRHVCFREGETVLEAGCGDGIIMLSILRLFNVKGFGVDFSVAARQQAMELMKREQREFQFELSDVRSLPYPDGFFDKVISLGVIEHMLDPMPAVKELYRVLKPGGQMILMTPNKHSTGRFDRILKQAIGTWVFGHQDEYSPDELERFARESGFTTTFKEAVLRNSLPNDNRTFKVISYLDRWLSLIFSNWGFYSYVFATK